MGITLQIEDLIHCSIVILVHTLVSICKAMKIQAANLQWTKNGAIYKHYLAWNVFFFDKRNSSCTHMSTSSKLLDEKPTWFSCRSSIRCTWNALNVNQNLKGILSTMFKRKHYAFSKKNQKWHIERQSQDKSEERLEKNQHHDLCARRKRIRNILLRGIIDRDKKAMNKKK